MDVELVDFSEDPYESMSIWTEPSQRSLSMDPLAASNLPASPVSDSTVSLTYSLDNPSPTILVPVQTVDHVSVGSLFHCYPDDPLLFNIPEFSSPSPSSLHFLDSCLEVHPPTSSLVDLGASRVFTSVSLTHSLLSTILPPPSPIYFGSPPTLVVSKEPAPRNLIAPLPMANVIGTTSRVLVGRVCGRHYTASHLRKWISKI